MNQITVGKKRNASFIPIDQNGNPNPVDENGNPLDVVGVPTWSLGPLETSKIRRGAARDETTGFTLVPSEDGRNCDVIADVEGVTVALNVEADRGDGVMVHGGAIIESVGAAGPVAVIGSLLIQFGAEEDA